MLGGQDQFNASIAMSFKVLAYIIFEADLYVLLFQSDLVTYTMHESKKQQIAELSRDGIGNGISPLTSRARGHQLCFLDLPREIRDEIYAYYLFPDGDRDPIIIPHICGYSLSRSGLLCCREDVWVDLLTVCKSISEEARLYLYSHCDFRSHWELNCKYQLLFGNKPH